MSTYLQRSKIHQFIASLLLLLASQCVSGENNTTNGENLALHKPTEQSTVCRHAEPSRAVDGMTEDGPCARTCLGLIHWWQVNLEDRFYVTLLFVTSGAFPPNIMKIETSEVSTMANPALCIYFTGISIGPNERRRLDCNYPVPGMFVRITTFPSVIPYLLALCEVEIYGYEITPNYTQHGTPTVTESTTVVAEDDQTTFTEISACSSAVYELRTRAGDIDNYQTTATPNRVIGSDDVHSISGSIHDYSQSTTLVSSKAMTKGMESNSEYLIITQTIDRGTSVSSVDVTPSMTITTLSATTTKVANDLTVSMVNKSEIQLRPLRCKCPCQHSFVFLDNMSLHDKIKILKQQLTVLKNQTGLYKRSLTSAADDRRSAVVIGSAGIVVLMGVLMILILCDAPRIARFLMMQQ